MTRVLQLESVIRPDAKTPQVELAAAVHPVLMAEFSDFSTEISKAFYKLGVTLKPQTKTMSEYLDPTRQASVDVVVGRWAADYPDADSFAYALHTRGPMFGRLVGTPELDGLIEQGRAERDPRARHALYGRIEQLLAESSSLLPLFHEQVYRFARPEVQGLSVSYWFPTVAYENLSIREH